MFNVFLFLFLFLMVLFSFLAILFRNPIYGVLSLFVAGLSSAGIFSLMNSYFIALIQIILYIGAVLVLFIFVISMMNLRKEEITFEIKKWRFIGLIPIAVIVPSLLIPIQREEVVSIRASMVGQELFSKYIFQFEYVSILLLAVVIAIIIVGRLRREEKEKMKRM